MQSIKFKVKLIEPLIISASDKTEASLNCLDYIPGNIFLGMVAGKLYRPDANNHSKILDLFHNGNVQFGNAYLSYNDKQSKPIPAVWYKEKGKTLENELYLYHKIEDEVWEQYAKDGKQIKQERNGYFIDNTNEYNILNAKKGVVLKSGYNSKRRSSQNKEMYLYEYLEAGQEFIFEVRSSNDEYFKEIEQALVGNKHISKSKTAEFGKVEITKIDTNNENSNDDVTIETNNEYLVLANSNLCFINDYGDFTWSPTAKDLGFKNAKINYLKSQIYFDKFHTRNGKRHTHDYDRLIIKKGSVFVLEKDEENIEIDKKLIEKGVGVFLSEGYGRVLVNPSFLNDIKTIKKVEIKKDDISENSIDQDLISILKEREEDEINQREIYKAVNEFIVENKGLYSSINKSQWGTIRSLIYQARKTNDPNTELYNLIFKYETNETQENKNGYIYHGRMGEKWVGYKRKKLLEFLKIEYKNKEKKTIKNTSVDDISIEKLLLLTIEMPKRNK